MILSSKATEKRSVLVMSARKIVELFRKKGKSNFKTSVRSSKTQVNRIQTRCEAQRSGFASERRSDGASEHSCIRSRMRDLVKSATTSLHNSERSSYKEHKGDALASGAEEGRDKLRKAAGSGKYAKIRRYPNGETRQSHTLSTHYE